MTMAEMARMRARAASTTFARTTSCPRVREPVLPRASPPPPPAAEVGRRSRYRARPTRRTSSILAAIGAMFAWIANCMEVVKEEVRRWSRARRRPTEEEPKRPVREEVIKELRLAEEGVPLIDEETMALVGGDAATAAARARATRAPRTAAAARGLAGQLRSFIEANPRLLAAPAPKVAGDHYDLAVEAWLLTRCEGSDASGWATGSGSRALASASGGIGARAGGTVRSLLDRLGYARGTTWPRSKGMARSLGAGDAEEVNHAEPIFAWEVAEELGARPPVSLWECAAAAMVVLGIVAARRVSGAGGLLVEQVSIVGTQSVRVAPRHRPKQRRERVGRRRSRVARAVVVDHWLIEKHVVPWVKWHQRRKSPGNGYFFPSVVQLRAKGIYRSSLGFAVGSEFWIEPLRRWSHRAVTAAVQRCVRSNGSRRTFQGLRSGNNIELRRSKEVSTVTRRTLHERSLKPVLGSEEAYVEVFAEDFADATRILGRLRIERDDGGLLSVTATSASCGQDGSDWVVCERSVRFQQKPGDDSDMSEDVASGEDTDGDVVGDGGEDTRVVHCGRCGRRLGARDYGFLCDSPNCTWSACTDCHSGGTKEPLWCPRHTKERMERG